MLNDVKRSVEQFMLKNCNGIVFLLVIYLSPFNETITIVSHRIFLQNLSFIGTRRTLSIFAKCVDLKYNQLMSSI